MLLQMHDLIINVTTIFKCTSLIFSFSCLLIDNADVPIYAENLNNFFIYVSIIKNNYKNLIYIA